VATTLNEIAKQSGVGITLLRRTSRAAAVRAACEMLASKIPYTCE